jgi:hypothetical protein
MEIINGSAPTGKNLSFILLETEEGKFILKASGNWSVPECIHFIYIHNNHPFCPYLELTGSLNDL